MKVLHIIPSLSIHDGGPTFCAHLILEGLAAAGVDVSVATTDHDTETQHLKVPLATALRDGDVIHYYFKRETLFYKVSRPLRNWLRENLDRYDLLHIHGLFSYTSVAAARLALRAGKPYLIQPHGVLNRWGMGMRRPWMKRLSLALVELPILRGAAAIHYATETERTEAAASHPEIAGLPSHVIRLGAFQEGSEAATRDAEPFFQLFPEARNRQIILFLSRIDPKKGLDLLLKAYARVRLTHPDSLLVLAGDGAPSYVQTLRAQAVALGLTDHIVWTGFLEGAVKDAAFSAATAFALPSYSENFGIAAAEAMAAGVPVILSDQVALVQDVREAGAGMIVSCDADPVAHAIDALLSDPTRREILGRRGRALALDLFSQTKSSLAFKALYQSICARPSVSTAPAL